MKIGLYNVEPKIVNTAMMQVSAYHKGMGDEVELYKPLYHHEYDRIYAFSLFNFTDKSGVSKDMIKGGTGFDIHSRLSPDIEACNYDWSLYPDCDFSIIWFSRGCIRHCQFCIVREKEGYICPVEPKNLNPNGQYIKVQDNNFFASPKWHEAVDQLLEWDQPVDFDGGIDVRIIDKDQCGALNSLHHHKQIKIAWDNPKENIVPHIERMTQYVKPYKIMCYVLIGFNSSPEEDMHRVMTLEKMGVDPYVMPYNKKDKYQRQFARWVNGRVYKVASWQDYDSNYSFKKWNKATA